MEQRSPLGAAKLKLLCKYLAACGGEVVGKEQYLGLVRELGYTRDTDAIEFLNAVAHKNYIGRLGLGVPQVWIEKEGIKLLPHEQQPAFEEWLQARKSRTRANLMALPKHRPVDPPKPPQQSRAQPIKSQSAPKPRPTPVPKPPIDPIQEAKARLRRAGFVLKEHYTVILYNEPRGYARPPCPPFAQTAVDPALLYPVLVWLLAKGGSVSPCRHAQVMLETGMRERALKIALAQLLSAGLVGTANNVTWLRMSGIDWLRAQGVQIAVVKPESNPALIGGVSRAELLKQLRQTRLREDPPGYRPPALSRELRNTELNVEHAVQVIRWLVKHRGWTYDLTTLARSLDSKQLSVVLQHMAAAGIIGHTSSNRSQELWLRRKAVRWVEQQGPT